MYIRQTICYWFADKIIRPIWEASLLYIAKHVISGYWRWIYNNIHPITSDAVLINRCKSIDDYAEFRHSCFVPPRVIIESDSQARVFFTAWGYRGMELWELMVTKEGDSVRFEKSKDTPKSLIYYEPKFVV